MTNTSNAPQSTSILIVDDTKFSSALIQRMLQSAGFRDIRIADNAIDALDALKQRPAELLLADWLMPGMDGLELTQLVRELNRRQNHFTYVMLLTAKEDDAAMQQAFAQGVDDFIGKTQLKTQLQARVHAGQRLSRLHNSLLERERQLKEQFRVVTRMNRLDAATGLGNAQFIRQQLERGLLQMKGRAGHLGLVLCRLDNLAELEQRYGRALKKEIIRQASQRLKEHSRPLDDIARLGENTLGLLFYGPGDSVASQALIRRLDQAIFTKAYSTSAGFVTLSGCIQLDLVDSRQALPDTADWMLEQAMLRLNDIPADQRQALHLWRGNRSA
ncbi:GGDEF domain-containing response regulator [Saccharospirillum salsuginis]|uniref:Transcriptional regulator n=1 Tax=Saccharospirillum salsuginis TaxID=418750 RepID=A0A918NCC1_9GAMM|nr:response regulator [Saccharospirillum salsuginis]GGX59721.1 transcriptional regulator [Saccharospirillum salsuginis]